MIWVCEWNDITAYVEAPTRGKAMYTCFRAARAAGYRPKFTEFRCRLDVSGLPPSAHVYQWQGKEGKR